MPSSSLISRWSRGGRLIRVDDRQQQDWFHPPRLVRPAFGDDSAGFRSKTAAASALTHLLRSLDLIAAAASKARTIPGGTISALMIHPPVSPLPLKLDCPEDRQNQILLWSAQAGGVHREPGRTD